MKSKIPIFDKVKKVINGKEEEGLIDIVLSKLTSRKLLIAIIATVLVIYGKITGDNWEKVIMVYLVSQSAADYVIKRYFGSTDNNRGYGGYGGFRGHNQNNEDLSGEGEDDLGGEYQKPEGENDENPPVDLG
jgi:hypothetical protein